MNFDGEVFKCLDRFFNFSSLLKTPHYLFSSFVIFIAEINSIVLSFFSDIYAAAEMEFWKQGGFAARNVLKNMCVGGVLITIHYWKVEIRWVTKRSITFFSLKKPLFYEFMVKHIKAKKSTGFYKANPISKTKLVFQKS